MILYCLYVIISPLLWLILYIVSIFNKKIYIRLVDSRNLLIDVKQKVEQTDKEILLFHSASHGELEQLKPILRRIERSKYFVLLTISSPSTINHIPNNLIDAFCYQVFDFPWMVHDFFKSIRPSKYIITRHDIWPNHVIMSKKISCKLFLINTNLPKSSKRKFPVFISLYRYLFSKFNQIHTVSLDMKKKLKRIIDDDDIIKVSGDTRVDQILYRRMKINGKFLADNFINSKNILFGSIEYADIDIIFKSISNIHNKKNENIKYIFVPHETNENLIKNIESKLIELNISFYRYSDINVENNKNSIIIDKVGILAELYKFSTIAYIGCGFSKGVHNVIEPAAYGNLICFGPNYHILNEAIEMVDKKLAYVINSTEELTDMLNNIYNDNYLEQQSQRIKNYINSKSESSSKMINEILQA